MKQTQQLAAVMFTDIVGYTALMGDILFPDSNGKNIPIDRHSNLSSIQQIKNSASPGQESQSVQEILYSKLNLESIQEQTISEENINSRRKPNWLQRLFGRK